MNSYKENETAAIVRLFASGGLLAFPTDTVYGLGTMYGDLNRLQRLKTAKHRPETKAVPFMTDSLEKLETIAEVSDSAKVLADSLLPGALTLVLKRKPAVDEAYTNGLKTIAVRIPDTPWLLDVMRQLPYPLLVTSANQSGEPAALTAQEAQAALPAIDAVVDGIGPGGTASTIVDCTVSPVKILRQGPIPDTEIRSLLTQAGLE